MTWASWCFTVKLLNTLKHNISPQSGSQPHKHRTRGERQFFFYFFFTNSTDCKEKPTSEELDPCKGTERCGRSGQVVHHLLNDACLSVSGKLRPPIFAASAVVSFTQVTDAASNNTQVQFLPFLPPPSTPAIPPPHNPYPANYPFCLQYTRIYMCTRRFLRMLISAFSLRHRVDRETGYDENVGLDSLCGLHSKTLQFFIPID